MRFAYLIEPPFNFRNQQGDVSGYDVEIAKFLCQCLGETFDPVETEFAQLISGLSAGKWDMTTGLFATPERRQFAQFTRPVWALSDGLLVPRHNPLRLIGYGSIAQHQSARLAVIQDQFQHRSAVEFGVESHRIQIFSSYEDAVAALHQGNVDAFASVAQAHFGFLFQNSDLPMDVVEISASEKPPAAGAFALALQDNQRAALVNEALTEFIGSAEHFALASKYGFTSNDIEQLMRSANHPF